MFFKAENTDRRLSEYTGLTRKDWLAAGIYLLTGIFGNIKDPEAPVVMPREEMKVTYPHPGAEGGQKKLEQMAEIFEGLARSFLIAAPLIHDNPDLKICGITLKDYYKRQIIRCCTKGDINYVGDYEELLRITAYKDPFRCFQQTVETCALVMGLWFSKNEVWDTYTKEERDVIAGLLSSYAHANTAPHNWRLFSMLDMAFLHMEGYAIDKEIMLDHAQMILGYYAGDGWYKDGHSFDYYSCWAFNLYAPLWNLWYGYENAPYIAQKFEEHSNKLMETYADFFDREGYTNMWGRSNIYRNAATSAFVGNMFLKNATVSYGLARRILSGSLMQFLGRDDFLTGGVPSLGFYGTFLPAVQSYSCTESVFWLGKAFLCLSFGEDHPFWTEKETNGRWEWMREKEIKETTLNGPGLCFSNHNANGGTILRAGKVLVSKGMLGNIWAYAKLNYNTKYPWEALPSEQHSHAGAQQYVIEDLSAGGYLYGNRVVWYGMGEGVLYRRLIFDYDVEKKLYLKQAVNLADFPVAYGIMRVDKHRLYRRPVRITLGAYGFPDNGAEIHEKFCGKAKAIILKGRDHTGKEKQLAMTIYDGWKNIKISESRGTNPDSEKSVLIYAENEFQKQYGGREAYVMVSQVLTKESMEEFSEEELFPVSNIIYEDEFQCGCYGAVMIVLKDGSFRKIYFDEMESYFAY